MATADELRRLGLGLGAAFTGSSQPLQYGLGQAFGAVNPPPITSQLQSLDISPETSIPTSSYFIEKTGRDGQTFFVPSSNNPSVSSVTQIFTQGQLPEDATIVSSTEHRQNQRDFVNNPFNRAELVEQGFNFNQFNNSLNRTQERTTQPFPTSPFVLPALSEIVNTLKKSNLNFKEVEEIDDLDNFIGNNPLDAPVKPHSERSDKELLVNNLQANKFAKTLPTGIISLFMKGLGKLESFQTQNEINKRGGQLELASVLANTERKGEGNLFQRLNKSQNALKTLSDTFTGKAAEELVDKSLRRADELNKINQSLAPNVPQQIEEEKARQANPFERQRDDIAQQQAQQQTLQEQQQQQLARQIGQGSVDDIDTSVDVPDAVGAVEAAGIDVGTFGRKEGGTIQKMQEGGEVAEAPTGEGMEMAGLINDPNAAPMGANADDVPMEVPEDSFIINAEAVQEVGLKDIYKAIDEAIILILKTGLGPQLPEEFKKEDRDTVPILASNGEVMIPPIIAKMIGEETLNKWNNKGRAIQEAKAAEEKQLAEQQAQQQQQQQAPVTEAPMQQGMA